MSVPSEKTHIINWASYEKWVLKKKEADDFRHRCFIFIVVEPRASRCNSSIGFHAAGLDEHQSGSADGVLAQMHQMPIGHATVDCGILAHRCHHNAVVEGRGSELAGGKKVGHELRAILKLNQTVSGKCRG